MDRPTFVASFIVLLVFFITVFTFVYRDDKDGDMSCMDHYYDTRHYPGLADAKPEYRGNGKCY